MGCSAEVTAHGGYGAEIDLDLVNVAIGGMSPEVIAVGETQERMLWVLPPEIVPEVLRIYNDVFTLPQIAHNARASVIGKVTAERRYVLRHGGDVVMDVENDFLTGAIRDELPYTEVIHHAGAVEELPAVDVEAIFPRVLAHRDVCSREPLYRRYDAVVRGRHGLAARARRCGRARADSGLAARRRARRVAGNPRYGRIDARYAAEHAVLDAMRCVVAVGADPIGLTDCLNSEILANRINTASSSPRSTVSRRAASELDLAFVSGNVSLYNESGAGAAVPASAIVACIGAHRDVAQVVTPGFKAPGRRCCGSAAASSSSAVRCSPSCSGSTARCRAFRTAQNVRAVSIVHDAIARGVAAVVPRDSRRRNADGGGAARVRCEWRRARTIGAEIDFGNPLCEAGGFICEVSDDSEIDLTGVSARRPHDRSAGAGGQRRTFRGLAPLRQLVAAARGDLSVSARIAVAVFPGTNSEDETVRLLRDCGGDAELVHWWEAETLGEYDAYVLPGRLCIRRSDSRRSDRRARPDDGSRDRGREGRQARLRHLQRRADLARGRPRSGDRRRPHADGGIHRNGPPAHFICRHVYLKLDCDPVAQPDTAALPPRRARARVGRARRGASCRDARALHEIVAGETSGVRVCERGRNDATDPPFRTAPRSVAPGLVNREGNVLAIMPHPERDAMELQPSRSPRGRRRPRTVRRRAAVSQLRRGAVDDRRAVADRPQDSRQRGVHGADGAAAARRRRRAGRAQRDPALRDATAISRALVARVEADETIFNPNKHRLTVLDDDAPRAGEVWIEPHRPAPARGPRGNRRWRLFDANGAPVCAERRSPRRLERLLCNPAIDRAVVRGETTETGQSSASRVIVYRTWTVRTRSRRWARIRRCRFSKARTTRAFARSRSRTATPNGCIVRSPSSTK